MIGRSNMLNHKIFIDYDKIFYNSINSKKKIFHIYIYIYES